MDVKAESLADFAEELPIVYRWPYEYAAPGVEADFVPQNMPPDQIVRSGSSDS